MSREPQVPRLTAVTRPLDRIPDIVALADPEQPLVWTRGDRGCVGLGETLRLTFSGPDRFAHAAAEWRRIAALASIDDPVGLPGTGLVALGTFAFDAGSAATSVLIVPRTLIARHRGSAWITEIRVTSAAASADQGSPILPETTPVRPWQGTALGTQNAAGAPGVAAYLNGVERAGALIADGALEKIVLARQVSGRIEPDADLRTPITRLADGYTDCWTFAVDGLVGASPETLVRSTGGAVSARVLAGTRRRHREDERADLRARNELLTSPKEQHEHAFAVQSVVTALAPHVRSLQTSEEPFPLQLPNVWHLATDLGATLSESSSALEVVGALHPTAAVAGTPTAAAIAAIAELEPFDRGRYAGAVGWIDAAGDGEWVIALRCAQVGPVDDAERTVTASAGGGIVDGSNPEHELAETVSKFRPITDAFA